MSNELLAMAIAPGAFLMVYFYNRDLHEPEPREKVLRVMGWGGAVSALALVVELVISAFCDAAVAPDSMVGIFLAAFLVAATTEELCKYLVVRKTIYHDPEFDEPYDGIVYCVAASLGFAIIENILYVLSNGVAVAIVRAFLSVPAHALFGVFLGYFMGLSKFAPPEKRLRYHLAGLAIAILTHGLYDFVLMTQIPEVQLTVLPMLGLFWVVGLWKVKTLVAQSPFIGQNPAPAVAPPPAPQRSELFVPRER